MATLRVSNQGQLEAAISAARGGDTILLASGRYDELLMNTGIGSQRNVDFASKVTIASENAGAPAVINKMLLRGAGNVELRDLKFDYVPGRAGDDPFWVDNSDNVTLDGVTFDGATRGSFGSGLGLRVRNNRDFTLTDSEFTGFRNGMHMTGTTDVTISNNDFRGMANDAMFIGGVARALIAGNDFRNMNSSEADRHKDMIQFFNSGSIAPSQDVVIRGNVIDNPEQSHGIFFGNALAQAGNGGAYYRNILIEDNTIRSAHLHGITIDHGANVTIRGNTLIANGDEGRNALVNIPLINVSTSSVDVTIQGNRAPSVPDLRKAGWVVSGNDIDGRRVLHWDGDYGANFGDGSGSGNGGAAPWTPVANDGGAGAPVGGAGVIRVDPIDGWKGGNERFLIANRLVDDGDRLRVEGLDFGRDDDDVIVFRGFGRDTFEMKPGGNPTDVWDDGRSARANSILDIQEIVRFSDDVTATTRGDLLVLRIAQAGEVAEIEIVGLGYEFRMANQPELF